MKDNITALRNFIPVRFLGSKDFQLPLILKEKYYLDSYSIYYEDDGRKFAFLFKDKDNPKTFLGSYSIDCFEQI